MVAPEQSRLVQRTRTLGRTLRRLMTRTTTSVATAAHTLADAAPNQLVRIQTLKELAPEQCDRLQAYGVQPGQVVRVREQHPITIIQVEHLELAMEPTIARAVEIEAIEQEES